MIIGITTTFVEEERGEESVPVERVTIEYIRRVAATGAVPVLLPPAGDGIEENERMARDIIERVDALVFTGGGDIDPGCYGETRMAETTYVFRGRDALELSLARLAFEHDVPALGICRGMQVLNVALGGTLYQDVMACGLTDASHQQKPPYTEARQRVDIAPGSLLERVLCGGAGEGMAAGCQTGWPAALEVKSVDEAVAGCCTRFVNSMHHQAIASLAPELLVSAVSGDGIIEGIEQPAHRFYLGVQWHPEYLDKDSALFQALADAAR